ncbi:methyltransferase [Rhodobacter sp. KR11]|uniref:tRNA1(Val) (adenine(37)-N6)-methyltransferase n=1 Tax=Rhodobacter sp. KR11 TaxID=2974588 RepID=UPI0022237DA9|nr:methyltransferase [Rhodobacter sp. KR11]MCW1920031.1 methyltransferase [Rhodobacter sp. KR11]
MSLTHDAFLCGRLHLWQPAKGYRAANDAVLLAAACPATAGQSVLDLGCGAGAASLCLAARVPGLVQAGLELQEDYADLARRNATENGVALEVVTGDLSVMPAGLRRSFDHVIANPPFYPKGGTPSPVLGRDIALRAEMGLALWVEAAARRLQPGGWLTMIFSTEGLPEVLGALGKMGSARVLPLLPREGREAKRLILRARKGGRAGFRMLAPLVLHRGAAHEGDREGYTPRANEILRMGAGLLAEFG